MKKNEHVKILQNKLLQVFNDTLQNGIELNKNLDEIDGFYDFTKAEYNKMNKFLSSNLCAFRYKYKEKESVLLLFAVPVNSTDPKSKHVSERIIEIIKYLEETFISLEYLTVISQEKHNYIVAIKSFEE